MLAIVFAVCLSAISMFFVLFPPPVVLCLAHQRVLTYNLGHRRRTPLMAMTLMLLQAVDHKVEQVAAECVLLTVKPVYIRINHQDATRQVLFFGKIKKKGT